MPKALPKEFRDNAVAMARAGDIPVAQVAKELGVSESGLRRWMTQADVEDGLAPGVTRSESADKPRPNFQAALREAVAAKLRDEPI